MQNARSSNPLLSLVACGRNDEYGGNFRWRLETAVNFTADRLAAIRRLDDVEFVIVDWGSPDPLHEVLNLNDHSRRICRFLNVPPSVTEAYDARSGFAGTLAMNVGIRRSRGSFIAQTGGDILYGEDVMSGLFEVLEGKTRERHRVTRTLFFIGLKNIPYDIASASPDIAYLERYIRESGRALPAQPLMPYLYGGAAALLAHRDRWFEAHALDETMIYWGWSDIDFKLRMCLKYSALDLGRFKGMYAYHLTHHPPGRAPAVADENRRAFNPLVVNDRNWGLAGCKFDEFPSAPPFDASSPAHETATVQPGWYRTRHFTNLLKFVLSHPDRESLRVAWFTLYALIMDLPDGSIIRRTACLSIAAGKRLCRPARVREP